MSKFGFEENKKINIEGLGTGGKHRVNKKSVSETVRNESEKLGYTDRTPISKRVDIAPKKRLPGRKPPKEPKIQLMVSGPESVINEFRDYCESNEDIPYWEGIQKLMSRL